jgi:hypothetical protein
MVLEAVADNTTQKNSGRGKFFTFKVITDEKDNRS